jgi:hypothetical protein
MYTNQKTILNNGKDHFKGILEQDLNHNTKVFLIKFSKQKSKYIYIYIYIPIHVDVSARWEASFAEAAGVKKVGCVLREMITGVPPLGRSR